jgi:uncharacterized membrane protein YfcA
MQTLGYLIAVLIGVVLGLIGGGGSILTVPVFVYLLSINPITATAYSLFVVGVSSLFGAIQNMRKGLVDIRTAIVFAIPALTAVYTTRKFILPAIPEYLFSIGNFLITKNIGIMVFFALIMLLASFSMIREKKNTHEDIIIKVQFNYPMIIIEGLVVGLLTGIVGAGGGFLIIPALVLLAKLPMKKAVATSLLIIAIKSLLGFIGDIENLDIDWSFLLRFTAFSIIGIIIVIWLNKFIDDRKLKTYFGWLVLLMAVYIIFKELFL